MNQAQNLAEFVIEDDGQAPVSDVIFTSTTVTFASSQSSACQPQVRGTNDYFSAPQASSDGLHCWHKASPRPATIPGHAPIGCFCVGGDGRSQSEERGCSAELDARAARVLR